MEVLNGISLVLGAIFTIVAVFKAVVAGDYPGSIAYSLLSIVYWLQFT